MRNVVKRQTGITLIALVVTIIVLIILAGVSINMLMGENGIINMAQRAKNEMEQAAKEEQQALAGMFGKSYADYNGQLHVEGKNLVNQYGEIIQLRGVSTTNGKGIETLSDIYYNKDSISSVKEWGANVFRIAVDTSDYYNGYVSNPNILQRVIEITNICIELDMYVIIDWHTLYEGDPNTFLDQSIDFFTKIANQFKDTPNVIYEICNEPNGNNVDWEVIKEYANTIIPIIRNINNNSIIIVGTPQWSCYPDRILDNELEYDNVMYTVHIYPDTLYQDKIDSLENAINNDIPLFATEWGLTGQTMYSDFYEATSETIKQIFNTNNISWCNWYMGEWEPLGLVKGGEWNNELRYDSLTASGKYLKEMLNNTSSISEHSIMMAKRENYAFWSEEYRNKITEIVFETTIDMEKINESLKYWNVSRIEENNNVIAYIEINSNNNETYTLHIAGNGVVYGTSNNSNIFSDFANLEKVDLSNYNTSNVNNMSYMFANDLNLKEIIGFENFNVSNVSFFNYMFYNCNNLISVDLSSYENVANVYGTEYMFAECKSLQNIKLPHIEKVSGNMNNMFFNCNSLSSLDLSIVNTTGTTKMASMFKGCNNLQSINLNGNFDTSNVTDMTAMFEGCASLKKIDLTNFNTKNLEMMSNMFAYCRDLIEINWGENFSTQKIQTMNTIFYECNSLKNLNLSMFDTSNVTAMVYLFYNCTSLETLDISSFDISKLTEKQGIFQGIKDSTTIYVNNIEVAAKVQEMLSECGANGKISYKNGNSWEEYLN